MGELDHRAILALLRARGLQPVEVRGARWEELAVVPAPDAATLAAVRAEYERQAGAPNPDAATLAAYLAKVAPSGTETAAALKALARRVGLR